MERATMPDPDKIARIMEAECMRLTGNYDVDQWVIGVLDGWRYYHAAASHPIHIEACPTEEQALHLVRDAVKRSQDAQRSIKTTPVEEAKVP
jgi:hypothetical protein